MELKQRSFKATGFAVPATILLILSGAHAFAANPVPAAPTQSAGRWRDASLDEYRQHLVELTVRVQACAKARDLKTCDTALIGPDDRVPLADGRRLVRYGWLRVLFSKAEDKDAAAPASGAKNAPAEGTAQPAPPSTSELLKDAETRLQRDLAQVNGAAPSAANAGHAEERDAMKQVLAGRDFRSLEEPSARDSAMEKIGNWLNRFFENAAKLRARSAWVGRAVVWGFILSVCVGLVWVLLQLERRWRFQLAPDGDAPAPGAPSARGWQLWLGDARSAVAAGLWREAIHSVYWASISRLESQRLWPADRARTPREYLALVAAEDPRRAGLATLTGSFERTWYGGRPAGEVDYRKAEEMAVELLAGGASEGAAAEGGTQ